MPEFLSLRISRSTPAGEAGGRVMLEQDPWDPYIGYLTKGGAAAYLHGLLFGEPGEGLPTENCGVSADDGSVGGTIYAYPDPHDLNYHLALSSGIVVGPTQEIISYAEVVQVQNDLAIGLRYPTKKVISAEWLLPSPSLAEIGYGILIDGGKVTHAVPTFGSLLVIYEVYRHVYTAKVFPREDTEKVTYQTFAYAVWDGGNNYLEYKPPADADTSKSSTEPARCNNAWSGSGYNTGGATGSGSGDLKSPRPEDQPPTAPALGDVERLWDYCKNQEVAK